MNISFTPQCITSGYFNEVSSAKSRTRSCIDTITLNNDGTMTIKLGIEAGNSNVSSYNVAAYGAYFDGVEKIYVHPSSEHTFYNSNWYEKISGSWGWYRLGTHEVTIPAAKTFSLKVKCMFYYGWDNTRWKNNLGCVSATGDTTVELPEYDAIVNTPDGWKKGKTYIKINDEWKECDIYCKVDSTWRRGVTS